MCYKAAKLCKSYKIKHLNNDFCGIFNYSK